MKKDVLPFEDEIFVGGYGAFDVHSDFTRTLLDE
jgi:hypothetical protein